ncbi:MAG: PEP/pyruvate-binding domain-containing protein [Deltaproteobacteria bacterium]|nr:PEP/pyruvate-binding domain-containing protein [Deltaproteobacteria bacterium]
MVETLNLFRQLYKKWRARRAAPREVSEVFRFKYTCFRDLLDSNAQLLAIITDIEEKLQGRQVFGMAYVRSQAARAAFHAFRMIKNLDVLSGHKYPVLYQVLDAINEKIKRELSPKKELPLTEHILFYDRLTKEAVDWVGGKNANLGEVKNRVGLPIPPGFAITTKAFEAFLSHNDLVDEINKRKMEIEPQDPESIARASRAIQELIVGAALPPELEAAIFRAFDRLEAESKPFRPEAASLRVSLRSSAIGEDSDLTFAGQYLTSLNVTQDRLLETYKEIVASLYTSRAMAYRLQKGIRDEDVAMSVACLAMVDSVASGVAYSRHPFNPLENQVIITAVWGLGPYAVDGTISPDRYVVAKEPDYPLVEAHITAKPVQLLMGRFQGTEEIPVPPEDQEKPCLNAEQIKMLADYAVKLEEHFRCPQDIEWALDRHGRLLILQTRPLHPEAHVREAWRTPQVEGFEVLLQGGDVAFPGVGAGPAYHISSDEDLLHFPEGAVLVAKHSSPKFVLVMAKAQAIVTDSGSVAGHMAAVAREFHVPSLLAVPSATKVIPPGEVITVDAYSGRVYRGRVTKLLAFAEDRTPHMRDTPVHRTLVKVAEFIVPLHLVDPKAADFTPEHCRSLHDLSRLVHEFSYNEMFKISDIAADRGEGALRLAAPVPLDLYLIDLGAGLTGVPPGATEVTMENIASVPFKALLRGMTHKELQALEPRPVQFSGLFAVMREQMLATPQYEERFGEKSYAIISDKYLNFSSRVGYHYSILDAYAGASVNKNYITFSFKGGAADDIRRNRRVRAIAIVLMGLDFNVDVKGDRVDARLQKYPAEVILEKLELIGRLLVFTRQMDMLMAAEASVEAVAQSFLAGKYNLGPEAFQELSP